LFNINGGISNVHAQLSKFFCNDGLHFQIIWTITTGMKNTLQISVQIVSIVLLASIGGSAVGVLWFVFERTAC
jgi:dolichyl-phosphate-mannose--protein O-mannosyl transferase